MPRHLSALALLLALVPVAPVSAQGFYGAAEVDEDDVRLLLIGAPNRTIVAMIMQQALTLGLLGFVVGKIAATFWAPFFPRHVLLEPGDAARGLVAVLVICVLASIIAIQAALRVDPAEAIGG